MKLYFEGFADILEACTKTLTKRKPLSSLDIGNHAKLYI